MALCNDMWTRTPSKYIFRHTTNGLVCCSSCKQDSLTCRGFSGKGQKEEGLVLRIIKWRNREFSPWQSSTSSPGWQVVEWPAPGVLDCNFFASTGAFLQWFNNKHQQNQHWNQGGTRCWLSTPPPEMVWHSRSQAAAVTGAWYWKLLGLFTFWNYAAYRHCLCF